MMGTVKGDMNCPRDNTTLIRKYAESHSFYLCTNCNGIWVKINDLIAFLNDNDVIEIKDSLKKITNFPGTHNESLPCPVDGKMVMIKQYFKTIQVDICIAHQGIWMDGSEINALLKMYRSGELFIEKKEIDKASDYAGAFTFLPDIIAGIIKFICESLSS